MLVPLSTPRPVTALRIPKLLSGAVFAFFPLLFAGQAAAQLGTEAQFADRPEAMLVVDFSGSMWGTINGRPKYEISNSIIERNFDEWNQSLELGVLAYGHRRKGDCRDIELAYRPGETSTRTVRNWVTRQRPVGKTPLGNSLITAANYFNSRGQDANLIVLSDGIESCGVDPCRTIRELQAAGAKLTAHVIGFDLNDRDANAVRCIADLTGGTYVGADRADQLVDGFRKAVKAIAVKDDGAEKALRETLDKSLDALRDASDKLNDANARADRAESELARAQAEIARLNAVLQDAEASIADLSAALDDCEAQLANVRALLDDAEEEIFAKTAALEAAENENLRVNDELAAANTKIAGLEGEIDALETQVIERDRIILQLEDQVGGLETEVARLQGELDEALRNRQLTVSSLDYGAFEGTTEPVDIAALVAERDSYLLTLQSLRQDLGFILDPLSQAQDIANAIPEEAAPIAVPAELNELIVLLATGVEGELPELEWTVRGSRGEAVGFRDAGNGARIPLPAYDGTFDVSLRLPGFDQDLQTQVDSGNPMSRRVNIDVGRLALSLPGSAAGVFFATINNDQGETVAKFAVETSGVLYLKPGLYEVNARTETDQDVFEVQIYAGKETAVPLRF